jgi:hypothetical protein
VNCHSIVGAAKQVENNRSDRAKLDYGFWWWMISAGLQHEGNDIAQTFA